MCVEIPNLYQSTLYGFIRQISDFTELEQCCVGIYLMSSVNRLGIGCRTSLQHWTSPHARMFWLSLCTDQVFCASNFLELMLRRGRSFHRSLLEERLPSDKPLPNLGGLSNLKYFKS